MQVLMTYEEAEEHDGKTLQQLNAEEPELVAWVEHVLDHARRQCLY